MTRRWSVIVPVKGDAAAKSRLRVDDELRGALALSFATDTISAALAVPEVAEVIVVGPASLETTVRGLGARRVDEPSGDGAGRSRLNSAIREGLRRVRDPRHATAVLLGDLPRLRPAELATALTAVRTPRGLVPDASGAGTVLTTALAGVRHVPLFGDGSAARHRAVGYVPIPLLGPPSMHIGLRGDVDTIADLGSTTDRVLGPATRAALR
ncbi:2-phospho-L-lactate guanylyltransferase [Naasia lichenicola]|uniref:2-phospho-L-lactate guanylyltransferase n=1 Tax=Naasia lichenicola TaxID=2565933 RepID=A0A4S4FNF1_9MICO|nr:2-phospho-L-lactate guanylyltransferase [Naasia lichenicola]THG31771.1 2-phospho-L-lactate guanylyltransferase [Naasia lichenicola]